MNEKPDKIQKKIEQIVSRKTRGYDMGPKDTQFLLGLVEAAEERFITEKIQNDERGDRLERLKNEPLSALQAFGWFKKIQIGKLLLLWRR